MYAKRSCSIKKRKEGIKKWNKQNFQIYQLYGRIQHGEKTDKKITELGYFLAKIKEKQMQIYLERFNKKYNKSTSIDIEFFNEEPLTIKYARYNQSGEVCYCMADSHQANQKTKDGWQKINCDTYNCKYRQKNEQGKCACNRIGWLKFLIPSVCKDRIFLMRITGQTSLNRLNEYFNLQKSQNISIKGQYTLFLKKEEQSNSLGKTFTNYVLDILKKEDSISQNPKTEQKSNQLSTNNSKKENEQLENTTIEGVEEKDIKSTSTTQNATENIVKESTKKKTKSTSKKVEAIEDTQKESTEEKNQNYTEDEKYKDYYALLNTSYETIANNEYLIGEFADIKDKICHIVIRPEDAKELVKCDIGTFVKLKIKEVKDRKFAISLEFVEKRLKQVAA